MTCSYENRIEEITIANEKKIEQLIDDYEKRIEKFELTNEKRLKDKDN